MVGFVSYVKYIGYHKKDSMNMILIPSTIHPSCFMASLGSVSLISSGKTETKAMLRNPPAENGRIQEVLASRDLTESNDNAAIAPNIPTLAVHI